MAKSKSSNPADAARKAARARELKRNKASRLKARETALVKQDLRPLESDMRLLESKARSSGGLSKAQQADLQDLKAEVDRIRKAKEEYLKLHPEHRKYVYPVEFAKEEARAKEVAEAAKAAQKNGAAASQSGNQGGPITPIVPAVMQGRVASRSIYFDPVFNPTGAPPPGMPYIEKPMDQWDDPEALSWRRAMGMDTAEDGGKERSEGGSEEGKDDEDDEAAEDDDEEEEEEDDDDIIMPSGPPPPSASAPASTEAQDSSEEDSDEGGIKMPSGPPPPPSTSSSSVQPPIAPSSSNWNGPPLPPGPPPPQAFVPYGGNLGMAGPSMPFGGFPRPPLGFGRPQMAPGYGWQGGPPQPMGHGPYPAGIQRPPPRPPRGYFGRNNGFQNPQQDGGGATMQHTDPLSADGTPTLTYQGWKARPRPGVTSSSPSDVPNHVPTGPKDRVGTSQPSPPIPGPPPPRPPPTTISAKPQLRDLKKEATAFVPAALRKKQAQAKAKASLSGLPDVVDAAPGMEGGREASGSGNGGGGGIDATGGEQGGAEASRKIGLMEALGKHLTSASAGAPTTGLGSGNSSSSSRKKTGGTTDYDSFLDQVGDLL